MGLLRHAPAEVQAWAGWTAAELTAGGIPTASTNPITGLHCCHRHSHRHCHPHSNITTQPGTRVPIPTHTHPCLLFPTQGTFTLSPRSILRDPKSCTGDWLVGRLRHRAEKGEIRASCHVVGRHCLLSPPSRGPTCSWDRALPPGCTQAGYSGTSKIRVASHSEVALFAAACPS